MNEFTSLTVNLADAAAFLGFKCKWRLIQKMNTGALPIQGFKSGKSWMFFKEELVNCARELQNAQRKIAQVGIGENICHLANIRVAPTGIHDSRLAELESKNQLAALFDQKQSYTKKGEKKNLETNLF